ncbi:MAG: bifunctional salicylyl-CoA 5-hydroxylase/oxidoreductase [Burkholderiales bacterium]|nr:bifunctional salicylyl-CoA 5-hydroxylase/oxidoreductase [Burkholderiales bacterium]
MKVEVLGGGPAGLYSAILIKKSYPDARIRVTERNRADDTFGFGIVLSDETLAGLRAADEPSYREIAANFAYWDDIHVHYKGTVKRSGGHGFSGLGRLALLSILQKRADQLGIEVTYQAEAPPVDEVARGADLVIGADGINSAVRERWKAHFDPKVDLRPNKFCWLGADMTLPGFTYAFAEDDCGIWNLHAYMYTRPGDAPRCTLVFETTGETFERSGLGIQDEAAAAARIKRLFPQILGTAPVLTNRSFWRNFPAYRCNKWSHENVVLLGDAAHTAHWSIGSGTKLALEDAIALHASIVRHPRDLRAALADYDVTRHEEADRIQHAANVSLVWFENVRRFWNMHPVQFNFSLMSRSKAITFENMRVRDAGSVAELEDWWNAEVAVAEGASIPKGFKAPPMFAPFHLRGMQLKNRVVVSPMAQYMARDGVPNDWHLVHYGARATGGAGLVFAEMTCPSADARITPGCTGLYNDQHTVAWRRIVEFVHANSDAKICMQLGHAGRKGSTQLGWETMDAPLPQGNWPLVSASPIAWDKANQVPREMTRADMDRIRDDFVAAARRAEAAGFDMLELHMAHGYLLASFLSPVTNKRTDDYGGSLANRMRWPLEVWDAVRAAWPSDKPMSVRLSATDWIEGGQTGADTVEIAKVFKTHGADLIDVSSGQTDPASRPVYGRMFQAQFAEAVRYEAGIATMAVGAITTADQVNTLLASGRADLVALARPHLANPSFTLAAAAEYDYREAGWPRQYLSGAQQAHTLALRARQDRAAREARLVERAAAGKGAGAGSAVDAL